MFLDQIIKDKRAQIEQQEEIIPLDKVIAHSQNARVRDFKSSIRNEEVSIIAEIKKASPSKGIICENFDSINIAQIYEKVGVGAISVLTEPKYFLGNDQYIAKAKIATSKPILRKDFIIDHYQIYQTKAIGADAILLIAAILGNELKRFYELARNIGLSCLVEVHNREELEIALNVGCDIIGINNRNLKNFIVDLKTTEELIELIPKGITVVSESGIKTPGDIKHLRSLGVNGVLIGETFMKNLEDVSQIEKFIAAAK